MREYEKLDGQNLRLEKGTGIEGKENHHTGWAVPQGVLGCQQRVSPLVQYYVARGKHTKQQSLAI